MNGFPSRKLEFAFTTLQMWSLHSNKLMPDANLILSFDHDFATLIPFECVSGGE